MDNCTRCPDTGDLDSVLRVAADHVSAASSSDHCVRGITDKDSFAAVGDGAVTATHSHFDSGDYDRVKTRHYYDYRGRLRGSVDSGYDTAPDPDVWADAGPIVVTDYDNMGRTTATAQYIDEPDWETVLGDYDYAETVNNNTYRRLLSTTKYDERGRVYETTAHEINQGPTDAGATTTNSMITEYWYDASGRQAKVQPPGTGVAFTKYFYDGLGRNLYTVTCSGEGTDTGAWTLLDDVVLNVVKTVYTGQRVTSIMRGVSPTLTSGLITGDGDMETVSENFYNSAYEVNNGSDLPYLTAVTRRKASTSASDSVFTRYDYDYTIGKLSKTISQAASGGATGNYTTYTYDALDRTKVTETFDSSNNSLAESENVYGTSVHLESAKVYKANAADYQETTYTYDGYGRQIQVVQPSGAFTHTKYSDYDRVEGAYLCSDGRGPTKTLSDYTVVSQTIPSYDEVGRVWLTAHYCRHDNATASGALNHSTGSAPKARVSYIQVQWFDDMGRPHVTANYGTNGQTVIDEESDVTYGTVPSVSTSDYLVTTTAFDGYGRAETFTDPGGKIRKTYYNDAGQVSYAVENFDSDEALWDTDSSHPENPADHDSDVNCVTGYTYTALGQLDTTVAIDPDADGNTGDNQTTTYAYSDGDTGDCIIPRMNILVNIQYPDGSAGDDVVITYYANGAVATREDQIGNIHTYVYDNLGRLTLDKTTTLGTGVDSGVESIGYTYDSLGRPLEITSYDSYDANGGLTPLNEIKFTYADGWGKVTKSEQDHDNDVVSGEPYVQYTYDDNDPLTSGDAKNIRLTKVRYPSPTTAREVYYNCYNDSDLDTETKYHNRLNRIRSISSSATPTNGNALDDANKFVQYKYAGVDMAVETEYPAVTGDLKLTCLKTSGDDRYDTLDRFGRVTDQWWKTGSDVDRFAYGHDYNSNRTWRENTKATDSKKKDELYTYDDLNRLASVNRGDLNGTYNGITTTVFAQDWTLHGTGNWKGFRTDHDGDGFDDNDGDLTQTREHNPANEIYDATYADAIDETHGDSWIAPKYDANGNALLAPRPGDEHTATEGLVCKYDAWNRLVKVYKDNGGSPGEWDGTDGVIAEYEYDGLDRRVVKLVPNANNSSNWNRTDYYYNTSWQVLEERYSDGSDGNGITTANKGTPVTDVRCQYIWSPRYIDTPILRDENTDRGTDNDCTDVGGSERLYYTHDANMNVTALVKDGSPATVVERYVYDPYGKLTERYSDDWTTTVTWANSKQNGILYCGYRYDDETEMYHVRHRYHHPTLGRWISRDPKDSGSPGGGYHDGINLYQYVRSNPVWYVDPEGDEARNVSNHKTAATTWAGEPLYSRTERGRTIYSTPVTTTKNGEKKLLFKTFKGWPKLRRGKCCLWRSILNKMATIITQNHEANSVEGTNHRWQFVSYTLALSVRGKRVTAETESSLYAMRIQYVPNRTANPNANVITTDPIGSGREIKGLRIKIRWRQASQNPKFRQDDLSKEHGMTGKYPKNFGPGTAQNESGALHDVARTIVHERTHLIGPPGKEEVNEDMGHNSEEWAPTEAGNRKKIDSAYLQDLLKMGRNKVFLHVRSEYMKAPMSCQKLYRLSDEAKKALK